jgi:hypothetical protein
MTKEPDFLPMKEFAKRNGVSYSWVVQASREGKLLSVDAGGFRLIPRDAFKIMMAEQQRERETQQVGG